MELKPHDHHLQGEKVTLRPLTENDWHIIAEWETDPEVIYWADTDPVASRTIEETKQIFRTFSQIGDCFLIQYNGQFIGDCCLQDMNLVEILAKYPGKICRRVDLVIGVKTLWNHGLGTDIIHTLSRFAFERENADIVFGLVGDYNLRSQKAFLKAGYKLVSKIAEPADSRARFLMVHAVTQDEWQKQNR